MCNICCDTTTDMIRLKCSSTEASHDMCHSCFVSTVASSGKCPYCRKVYHSRDTKNMAKENGIKLPTDATIDVINDIFDRFSNNEPLAIDLYEEFADVVDWVEVLVSIKDYIQRMHAHLHVQPKDNEWTRQQIRIAASFSSQIGQMI